MAARFKLVHDAAKLKLNSYYENMIIRTGWATLCEIKAAPEMLHRKINV